MNQVEIADRLVAPLRTLFKGPVSDRDTALKLIADKVASAEGARAITKLHEHPDKVVVDLALDKLRQLFNARIGARKSEHLQPHELRKALMNGTAQAEATTASPRTMHLPEVTTVTTYESPCQAALRNSPCFIQTQGGTMIQAQPKYYDPGANRIECRALIRTKGPDGRWQTEEINPTITAADFPITIYPQWDNHVVDEALKGSVVKRAFDSQRDIELIDGHFSKRNTVTQFEPRKLYSVILVKNRAEIELGTTIGWNLRSGLGGHLELHKQDDGSYKLKKALLGNPMNLEKMHIVIAEQDCHL